MTEPESAAILAAAEHVTREQDGSFTFTPTPDLDAKVVERLALGVERLNELQLSGQLATATSEMPEAQVVTLDDGQTTIIGGTLAGIGIATIAGIIAAFALGATIVTATLAAIVLAFGAAALGIWMLLANHGRGIDIHFGDTGSTLYVSSH